MKAPNPPLLSLAGIPDDRLLRLREVAEYLRRHPATLGPMIRSGQLPHVRVGRSIRVRAGALRQFVREESRPRSVGTSDWASFKRERRAERGRARETSVEVVDANEPR
jgi:excisionase family DNA binding protein